jgi:hypothetical protein
MCQKTELKSPWTVPLRPEGLPLKEKFMIGSALPIPHHPPDPYTFHWTVLVTLMYMYMIPRSLHMYISMV